MAPDVFNGFHRGFAAVPANISFDTISVRQSRGRSAEDFTKNKKPRR